MCYDAHVSGAPNAQPVGIVGQFENILKILTGAVSLVTAIGFPAVAIHLVTYGVPVRTASYDFIFSAGLLPAFVLVVMVAYAYVASKIVANAGVRGLLTASLLPVFLPALLVLIAGTMAYVILLFWAMLWTLAWVLRSWSGRLISNQTLLVVSAVGIGAIWALYLLAMATRRYWGHRSGRFWRWLAGVLDSSSAADSSLSKKQRDTPSASEGQRAEGSTLSPTDASPPEKTTSWSALAIGLVFIPISILVLYSIRGVLYVWDPRLGAFLPHRYIFYTSIVFGLLFTLLMFLMMTLEISRSASDRSRTPSRSMIATVVLASLLFEAAYSTWAYPRLYSGLGGGRPTPVTVWLKTDDSLADILSLLPQAKPTIIVGAKKLDDVSVLFENADGIVLTDTSTAPRKAIFIRRDRVTAISW